MAIQTIKATIQMRRGLERDFDADRMVAGEWAVSTDNKYVRMCFMPGLCLRIATYEAFEQDMREIQTILATCQNIQSAVDAMARLAEQHKNNAESYSKLSKSWAVGGTGVRAGENTDNSKYYSQQSSGSATLSRSWAVGGTNTRTDEDTDNSEYYSRQSRKHSEISKEYLARVEQAGDAAVDAIRNALDIDAPDFKVDIGTGHILWDGGRFNFLVNRSSGHLEWGLAV